MANRDLFNTVEGVKGSGSGNVTQVMKVDILATDAAGDVLFLAPVSGDLIPVRITGYSTGVTGGTDVDLGFYKSIRSGGAVFDKDVLADGIDISTAASDDFLAAVSTTDRYKNVRELLGANATLADTEYNLCLTLVSEVTANGTLTLVVEWAQG